MSLVSFRACSLRSCISLGAAANQGGDAFGDGAANNQAAQAIDQSGLFGGGINQGQAGELDQN
jgi:hypothetical protein